MKKGLEKMTGKYYWYTRTLVQKAHVSQWENSVDVILFTVDRADP